MLLNTLLAAATLLPTHTAALPAATPTEPKAPPRRPEAGIAAAVTVAPPTPATVAAVPAVRWPGAPSLLVAVCHQLVADLLYVVAVAVRADPTDARTSLNPYAASSRRRWATNIRRIQSWSILRRRSTTSA